MSQSKQVSKGFHGYHVPPQLEAIGEKDYKKICAESHNLLFIGNQIKVWGGEDSLDFLALDGEGVPWIFEFKRDVAKASAISQLLTYGSYIAGLTYGQLDAIYRKHSGKKKQDLSTAFHAHFGPDKKLEISHRVQLVLAAYDFSDTCLHTLDFLDNACGLRIGRMKMTWIIAPGQADERKYWYQLEPEAVDPAPWLAARKFAMVAYEFYSESDNWDLYRLSNLLVLPQWNENVMDPLDRPFLPVIPYSDLKRGMGVFVWLKVKGKIEDGPEGPNDTDEGSVTEGLAAYGVIQDDAHECQPTDLAKLREKLRQVDANLEASFNHPPWLVQVQWSVTHPFNKLVTPRLVSQDESPISFPNRLQASSCLKALGLRYQAREVMNDDPSF
jgi:hypothetical protein